MPYRHTGGAEEWLHAFLTSVPDGGVCVCVANFTPCPLYSLYDYVKRSVGLRDSLHVV